VSLKAGCRNRVRLCSLPHVKMQIRYSEETFKDAHPRVLRSQRRALLWEARTAVSGRRCTRLTPWHRQQWFSSQVQAEVCPKTLHQSCLGAPSGGSLHPRSTHFRTGIGKALTKAYLSLPDHNVIAALRTTRGPQADQLRALSVAPGTQLHLVAIENTSSTDPNAAIARITSTDGGGITHIDIVIANSAISIGGGPPDSVDPKDLTESFNTNAVSNLTLFSAARALLERSSKPKWIAISTRVASIAAPLPFYPYAATYGMSKAAQNWFTQ
jgi:hypothetical protein